MTQATPTLGVTVPIPSRALSDLRDISRPYLGVCLIVKDGERTLPGLLADLKGPGEIRPFDEIVIVDTGSTDKTRELVIGALLDWGKDTPERVAAWWEHAANGEHAVFDTRCGRVVLAKFTWIKDFAAARNFAFSLGTAEWRGYFDADDRVPDVQYFRKTLRMLLQQDQRANCVVLPYDYIPGLLKQEVSRFFRLALGEEWGTPESWLWEDEIHEHVVGKQKALLFLDALLVSQDKSEAEFALSRTRNREILLDAYEKEAKGTQKRGRMAFHLAHDCTERELPDAAISLFLEAAAGMEGTSLAPAALIYAARTAQAKGDLDQAMGHAGRAMAEYPMVPETTLLVAVLNAHRGAYNIAADYFDQGFKVQSSHRRTVIDRTFEEGVVPSHAALAYLRMGRLDDAMAQLKRVPTRLFLPVTEVRQLYYTAQDQIMRAWGMRLMEQMVEFYSWDTESLKALDFLRDGVPASLADQPEIAELRAQVESKIPHILGGWGAYQHYYCEVPREKFFTTSDAADRDKFRLLGRALKVIDWAKSLPLEGPPVRVLAIGSNDAAIEEGMLKAHPRIHVTLADAGAQTSEILADMQRLYGADRVRGYNVARGHYDWFAQEDRGSYDAVTLFEVLEHVPDEERAICQLRGAIKEGGRIFLSTPNARRWVEQYLTGDVDVYKVFWHVRANNPQSLARRFLDQGLEPTVSAIDHEGNLFVEATKMEPKLAASLRRMKLAIFAHGGRPNFDPLTVRRGFLGGSETAVTYLAEALARAGHEVTVFTEKVVRPEYNNSVICRYKGVTWRDSQEYHQELSFDAVFYWRCPGLLATMPEWASAKHQKVLWLHDCAHKTGALGYDKADTVLALSVSHARALEELDGYAGLYQLVANGLDPAAFPPLGDVSRDSHRAVYASSPDRGLERLLEMWPAIRAQVPDAKLDIYYDWKHAKEKLPELVSRLEAHLTALLDQGVTYYGGVPQAELHKALRGAGVWPYPTSGPAETFCILATSAMASGCWPVVPNAGALAETLGEYAGTDVVPGLDDSNIDTEEGRALFVAATVQAMGEGDSGSDQALRQEMRAYALRTYNWDEVAKGFVKVIK